MKKGPSAVSTVADPRAPTRRVPDKNARCFGRVGPRWFLFAPLRAAIAAPLAR